MRVIKDVIYGNREIIRSVVEEIVNYDKIIFVVMGIFYYVVFVGKFFF